MVVNAVEDYHGVPIGRRIHVTGNSCSGKSTVGAGLAACMQDPEWRHIAFLRLGSAAEIEAFSRFMRGVGT